MLAMLYASYSKQDSSLTELHLNYIAIIPKLAEQTSSGSFQKCFKYFKSLKLLEVSENGVCMFGTSISVASL